MNGDVVITGATRISGSSSEENSSWKYFVIMSIRSFFDVTSLNFSSYITSGFRGFREFTFRMA